MKVLQAAPAAYPYRYAALRMALKLKCCICKRTLDPEPPNLHSLDPCALEFIAHADRDWSGQKAQSFWCHFECFRRLIDDDSLLYIAEPDYPTHGEHEAEASEEEDPA